MVEMSIRDITDAFFLPIFHQGFCPLRQLKHHYHENQGCFCWAMAHREGPARIKMLLHVKIKPSMITTQAVLAVGGYLRERYLAFTKHATEKKTQRC